jgi:hypothetical protein
MTYNKTRLAATAVGILLLAVSAANSVTNLHDGGVPLLSPVVASVIGLAMGSAVAVRAGMYAWRHKRRVVAILAFVFLASGETFELYNSGERLLIAREHRVESVASQNLPFETATARVAFAEGVYRKALAAVTAEAERGGCGRVCRDLSNASDRARTELENARLALQHTPPRKPENVIASVTGWPVAAVEIAPALLFTASLNGLAFVLLAIGDGTESVRKRDPTEPAERQPPVRKKRRRRRFAKQHRTAAGQSRSEQVAAFCKAFRDKHGREPSFAEVRDGTQLPSSTVSKYRRAALG